MLRRFALSSLLALCATAQAGTITSATSAVINSGGPGAGSLQNTYNQAGLTSHYISGVTDFASYIASRPLHAVAFTNEWFSELGTTAASVTYDLGGLLSISGVALWNEDTSGIGALSLYQSADGINFTLLAGGLLPNNNAYNEVYGPDVFAFAAVNSRYVRFDMSNCPQSGGTYNSCAIGEVAFNTSAAAAAVPEPASIALLGLGLAGIAGLRRRQRAAS